jgi:hypothetical protein
MNIARQAAASAADKTQLARYSEILSRFYAAPPSRTVAAVNHTSSALDITYHSSPHALLSALLLLEDIQNAPSKTAEFVEHLNAQYDSCGVGLSTLSALVYTLHNALSTLPTPEHPKTYQTDVFSPRILHRGIYVASRVALAAIDATAANTPRGISNATLYSLLSLPQCPVIKAITLAVLAMSPDHSIRNTKLLPKVPYPIESSAVLQQSGVLIPLRSATDVHIFDLTSLCGGTEPADCNLACVSEEGLVDLSTFVDANRIETLLSDVKRNTALSLLIATGPIHNIALHGPLLSACAALGIRVVDNVTRAECDRICALASIHEAVTLASVQVAAVRVEVLSLKGTGIHRERFYVDPDAAYDEEDGEEGRDSSDLFVHLHSSLGAGSAAKRAGMVNAVICGRTRHLAEQSIIAVRRNLCVMDAARKSGSIVPGAGVLEALVAMSLRSAISALQGDEAEVAAVMGCVAKAFDEMALCVVGRTGWEDDETSVMDGGVDFEKYANIVKGLNGKVAELAQHARGGGGVDAGWWADKQTVGRVVKGMGVRKWDEWATKRGTIERGFMMNM